jgi:hypothetical protein
MPAWLNVVLVLAFLGAVALFFKKRRSDQLGAMMRKRQASSTLVTRAEYVEGMERMPVVLALTRETIHYENPDLEASFDLNRLDEIEYADDLATGRNLPHGCRVLRLRSHGAVFEFLLPQNECPKWMAALPPHRIDEPPTAAAV